MVLRTARYLCREDAEADDVAQETMIKAFRRLDSFAEGSDTKAWLLTILRNTRIDHLRSKKNTASQVSLDQMLSEPADESETSLADDPSDWFDPEAMLQGFSDQQMIDALRKIPEEIRWTLLLVDVQCLEQREAAVILDVPEGTVKSRAHRGRAMLRALLLPLARDIRIAR